MANDSSMPESKCDVLIVGAGPAGLMMATWMAHCGINARIVDKRGTKIFNGQADGLQCRTLEIFDSFGFADRVVKEANHMMEFCMWNPGPDGTIRRSDRIPDTIPGISRFHEIVLHQGRIERFFLDNIAKYSNPPITVERGVLPTSLSVDESLVGDHNEYPITATLKHLSEEEATPEQQKEKLQDGLFRSNLAPDDTDELVKRSTGKEGLVEVIKAKYMVGCDGAHSWTRRQLGYEMQGEATDFIWGVIDIIPKTDFPDIRKRCAVHSADSGSLMVIPRENKLVRFYIQLKEVKPDASGRADRSKITPETILSAAQKIIAPYTLTYDYCDWWTAYQIGQRVGTHFDYRTRVFLAGDAVHTHSPKAGQGMNVSMQDSYNLGWKLALVAKGICKPEILATYETERRQIAQDLIAFDHKFSRLFSGRPAKDVMDEEGVSMAEFKEVFQRGSLFAAGLSVEYGPSVLVANAVEHKSNGLGVTARQHLIRSTDIFPIKLGMRLASHTVVNQADVRPWSFQQRLKSDGRFRIVLFAGNILSSAQKQRVQQFCDFLTAPQSFFRKIAPANVILNSKEFPIEILTVHSAPREDVELLRDFPDLLHPWDERTGWDYEKVFVDGESYHEEHGRAYEKYGVDSERGLVVVLRPDQYVGWIGELEDVQVMEKYFEAIFAF